MLETVLLCAGYSGSAVLHDVSLSSELGAVTCILGKNGSGKTTLLRSMTGCLREYGGHIENGQVLLDGRNVTHRQTHELLGLGLAFVPGGGNLVPWMTVRENVKLGGILLNNERAVDRRVDQLFEEFPLLHGIAARQAAALSAGERQIVAIARGLVLSPKAVVLDEPLQGLSPQYSRIVLSKLRSIASSSAVLVVEQNARLVLEYADRGYVLRQGEIALEGDSATLQASFAEGPGH